MSNLKIYILTSDENSATQFQERFVSVGYDVNIFQEINEVLRNVNENNLLLILVDYDSIVAAERKTVIELFKIVKITRAVVYNVPEDTDRRIAFYELGATRVFDKSTSVENISNSIRWLLQVLSSSDDGRRLYSKGKIEDIPLTTLINTLGRESRSGVLKIITENNSGKIYFNNGDITSAEVGFHHGERALIHMLFWDKGAFSFSSLQKDAPTHNVEISNIGIQIISKTYFEKHLRNLDELGSLDSTIRIQNTGDLLINFSDIDKKFIEFMQRPHSIEEVLENPYYTSFETVDNLLKLKSQNFLLIQEPAKEILAEDQSPEDIEETITTKDSGLMLRTQDGNLIRKNLQIDEGGLGKILVFSTQTSVTEDFLNDLVPMKSSIRSEKNFDIAQVLLSKSLHILFIALAINKEVMEILKSVSDQVSAQVFLIEKNDNLDFEYLSYIIRQIFALNYVPTLVAVSNISSTKELTKIKPKFDLPEQIRLVVFNPDQGHKAIRKILVSLEPIAEEDENQSEKEEKTI